MSDPGGGLVSLLLAFSALLVVAVYMSALAHRTVLSTNLVFLVGGFLLGGVLGVIDIAPRDPIESQVAELALFSILFTDGMRVDVARLRRTWALPARVLVVGLPITALIAAVAARVLLGLGWTSSALLAAILAPTDPVFASAIIERDEIPPRVRDLLNVESGLNDGIALPLVLALLTMAHDDPVHWGSLIGEAAAGIGIGVAIALGASVLCRVWWFGASAAYEPAHAVAVGLLILSVSRVAGANEFLAAFAGGTVLGATTPRARDAFHAHGELVADLLKLAAIMLFGALISPSLLADVPAGAWVLAAVLLLVARPVAVVMTLIGTPLPRRERAVAAWFGPKGFASIVYSLLALGADVPDARAVFRVVAVVVVVSIIVHSSTDTLVARSFDGDDPVSPGAATT